ncbi:hypothetical protein [Streptomyces sp. NPDC048462]|uniref:hypothetical protein n=1 Tax=Streptomyces sp. NPDC048462 TaxID=3365555 RepID=UPI00371C4367
MNERDVLPNGLAQGLRPMSQGIEGLDRLGQEEQAVLIPRGRIDERGEGFGL